MNDGKNSLLNQALNQAFNVTEIIKIIQPSIPSDEDEAYELGKQTGEIIITWVRRKRCWDANQQHNHEAALRCMRQYYEETSIQKLTQAQENFFTGIYHTLNPCLTTERNP